MKQPDATLLPPAAAPVPALDGGGTAPAANRPQGVPIRATAPYDWHAIQSLILAEFAYMEGRIDPPSAAYDLTVESIEAQARGGEVWVIEEGGRPIATAFLTPCPPTLYIGRLAVARPFRNAGHGRALIDLANRRAHEQGLHTLTLQSRIELTEVHMIFTALGFEVVGTTAHPGYARPTSITMQRAVHDP